MNYSLAPNTETITLERSTWTASEEVLVDGPDERAYVCRGGEQVEWRAVP